jgi:hypothetical protein
VADIAGPEQRAKRSCIFSRTEKALQPISIIDFCYSAQLSATPVRFLLSPPAQCGLTDAGNVLRYSAGVAPTEFLNDATKRVTLEKPTSAAISFTERKVDSSWSFALDNRSCVTYCWIDSCDLALEQMGQAARRQVYQARHFVNADLIARVSLKQHDDNLNTPIARGEVGYPLRLKHGGQQLTLKIRTATV